MLAIAIAAALAFWAPYNGGVAPCGGDPGNVIVHVYHAGDTFDINGYTVSAPPDSAAFTFKNYGCEFFIEDTTLKLKTSVVTQLVAHELGHAVMGLDDVDDPKNIMDHHAGDHVMGAFKSLDPKAIKVRVKIRKKIVNAKNGFDSRA